MTAREEMSQRSQRGFRNRVGPHEDPQACWLWRGILNKNGYGRLTYVRADGRALASLAHRIAYELVVGPIPEGMQLDHLCEVRACVNPGHLEPVTAKTNSWRSSRYKGGGIERRQNDWRVVWRVDGKRQYRLFDTELEAKVFVAEMFFRRGVA